MIIPTLLLLAFCISSHAQTRYKLKDAIAKGIVRLKITADGHTGRCASVSTENLTNQTVDIDIDCGQKIQSSDSNTQNLVITQAEHVRLNPKKIIVTAVFALCINAHKGSPGRASFRLGQMAQGALLRISQFIEKKKYQNSNAQSAVWSITDGYAIANIGTDQSSDYEMINELRGFVAKEKNITNYPKSRPLVRPEKITNGTFDVILQTKGNVELVLVDATNKTVKLFLRGPKDAGIIRVDYSVKNTDYKAGRYFIVMRVNGKEVKREAVILE
jgi:hypothetical protein